MKHTIDAKNKILGRLASEIAHILQGKSASSYNPRLTGTDEVFVKNVANLMVSGNKARQKLYRRHSGYIGHMKEEKFEDLFKRDPKKVLRLAVMRMLPKNRLQQERIKRLVIE